MEKVSTTAFQNNLKVTDVVNCKIIWNFLGILFKSQGRDMFFLQPWSFVIKENWILSLGYLNED